MAAAGRGEMTAAGQPLVSVLTPVYNGAEYLRECIESVLAQTYGNWEYVIVDNCSSDRTLEIARGYAARDPRIRIVTNAKFVRVIENHNIAFREMSPQARYCKVVAADDWIFPDCLEKMVELAEAHPGVAIVGAYGLATGVLWAGLPYPSTVVPGGRDACRLRLLGGPYVFGTPGSVLYRADIVRSRHAFYNESNFHADAEACFEFLGENDFGFVHQVLTFRRMQEESLTSHSVKVNTYLPEILYELVRYGPKYLSAGELETRLRAHLSDYYRHLGEQLFKRRGREFWTYHRGKMAAAGHPLRRAQLAWAAVAYLLDKLLNPKRTVENLLRRLTRNPPRWSG
jgi:glycosyltransferase involved in cell wall biosynthesis